MGRSIDPRVGAFLVATALVACLADGASRPLRADASLPLSEMYVRPVGPRGLEPTAQLLALQGKRVLIQGYMVREEEPFPGYFMLASVPVTLAERGDGPADYLPLSTVFVHLPAAQRDEMVGYVRSELELAGTLELGAKEETSGRISYVRLRLDDLNDARNLPKEQTE